MPKLKSIPRLLPGSKTFDHWHKDGEEYSKSDYEVSGWNKCREECAERELVVDIEETAKYLHEATGSVRGFHPDWDVLGEHDRNIFIREAVALQQNLGRILKVKDGCC